MMGKSAKDSPTWKTLSKSAQWTLVSVFVTNIGNGIQNLAVAKLLYAATGSTVDFGLTLIIENILTFVLQLFAGPLVDRGRPNRVMVFADLGRGGVVCLSSLLLTQGHVFLWVAIAIVTINMAKPFYRAATFSLGPLVAEGDHLLVFNSLRGSIVQGGQMVGVAIAGPLIYWLGTAPAFAANGVSYLLAAGAIALTRVSPLAVSTMRQATWWRTLWADWGSVFRYLRREWGLFWHMLLMSGDFLVVSFLNIAIVPIVAIDLHNQSYWLSVLDGSFAVGSLITSALAPVVIAKLGYRWSVLTALAVESLLFGGLSTLRQIYFLSALMVVFGAANTVSVTVFMTTLQRRTERALLGRIASIRSFLLSLLSLVFIPLITKAQNLSLSLGLRISGVVTLVFLVAFLVLGSRLVLGRKLLEVYDRE